MIMLCMTGIGLLTSVLCLTTDQAGDVVARMTDKTAAWEIRCAAEDFLVTMPPQDVLLHLLPYIEQDRPSWGIWNSGGREMDKEAPVEWQIYDAVARSWRHQVGTLPKDTGGAFLLTLLKQASTSRARVMILDALAAKWVSEAENPIAAMLTKPGENDEVRRSAALALILHGKSDYRDLLLSECSNASESQKRYDWFELLTDRRCKFRTGIDPKIIKMGFDLILKGRKLPPGNNHDDGYAIAAKVGEYIGQRFMPDQTKPEYQGNNGLSERFYTDTVKRALNWWSVNKGGIEKELETKKENGMELLKETRTENENVDMDKEVVELHPTVYGMDSVGIRRFSRFDINFSIDLRGFHDFFFDDGPYMVEPKWAILGTFAASLPTATDMSITEFYAFVIVKDTPLIEGKRLRTIDQFVQHLTEGGPGVRLAYLRRAGDLIDARPFQSRNIQGAILCYKQEIQEGTSTTVPPKTEWQPKTKWHFDFISLIQQKWLQVQFSIVCRPGTPFPERVFKRVQTILSTIRFHSPLTSSLEALEIAKLHIEAIQMDTTLYDMSKPEKVQEIRMNGRKAWRASWRLKYFTGKGGQLIVIVKMDGNCQVGWGE